jgi:uncharacterized protein (TIGR02646 family)
MRAIRKQGTGGYHLEQAHANPPLTNGQATSRWHSFNYKPQVIKALLAEQYRLCCYSELRADEEGLGYHIEHVQPKRRNPARTFDYQNLAASALDSSDDLQDFQAQRYEVFGGHAKRDKFDPARFISCHQPNCGCYFAYLSDGRVVPQQGLNALEQDQAQYTIDTLNLNSPYLITRRRQWWDELDRLFQEHTGKKWSLSDLAAVNLLPTNGALSRFFSLTRQFFGQVAEQILRQHESEFV